SRLASLLPERHPDRGGFPAAFHGYWDAAAELPGAVPVFVGATQVAIPPHGIRVDAALPVQSRLASLPLESCAVCEPTMTH
ncbi:MAG TPA: hypothetical protein PKV97_06840, partial [Thauera aminoaromatica]|nr:hypothetical protein [Thauera aminoaromatica]